MLVLYGSPGFYSSYINIQCGDRRLHLLRLAAEIIRRHYFAAVAKVCLDFVSGNGRYVDDGLVSGKARYIGGMARGR